MSSVIGMTLLLISSVFFSFFKVENNPRTGNFSALVRVFLGRTKELKISTECQEWVWESQGWEINPDDDDGPVRKDNQALLWTLFKRWIIVLETLRHCSYNETIHTLQLRSICKSGTDSDSLSRPFSVGKSIFDPVPILTLSVMFPFLLCSQLFIWQAHNALFMIRCLLKVFIREMSEEELHLHFSYQERAPGSCGGESLLKAGPKKRCSEESEAVLMLLIYIYKVSCLSVHF